MLYPLTRQLRMSAQAPLLSVLVALIVVLTAAGLPVRSLAPRAALAADTPCVTSGPAGGTYTVRVCITAPTPSSTVSGDTLVTATATRSGTSIPAIRKLNFYLDGAYLISDVPSTYRFQLPTARWVDGAHLLAAEVEMADGFRTSRSTVTTAFANGVTQPPVNTRSFSPTTPGGSSLVVAAVGDGADSGSAQAGVVNQISTWSPDLLLYLGDVYDQGTPTEFRNWYQETWGRFRSITNPTIGNHEWPANGGAGYFDYWDNIPHYYSYNAGGWHFVSLNDISQFGQTSSGSAQINWLVNDLQQSANPCTIVSFHVPVIRTGAGVNPRLSHLWSVLAQHGVDIVLTGDIHRYERWKPMNKDFAVTTGGVTHFMVGTGGHTFNSSTATDSRLAASVSSQYGALKLGLSAGQATFAFTSSGGTVLDSGTIPCSGDGSPPPPTSDVAFAPVADARVSEAAPTSNYGTSTTIVADAGTGVRAESYLTFTVSGLTGSVERARILLYVTNGSADGPDIYRVSDTSWGETSITWANRPARDSGPIDGTGAIPAGAWIELDVTGAITGNGTYSFALATGSTDGTTMRSRQSSTNKPQLVLSIDGEVAPPTSTPTATRTPTVSPTFTATPSGNPGQVVMTPVADARIQEANPTTNYGTSTLIRADAGTGVRVETYLKFTVGGISNPVTSATLRVYASSGSVNGPDVYSVSNSTWTEPGLTWANRPARSGTAVASTASVATGTWIELDVTGVVTGNGTFSFALATGSTDGTDMHSREATNKPQLVLGFGGVAPPPATTTPTPVPTVTATRTPTATRVPATVTPTATAAAPTATNTIPAPTEAPTSTALPPTATSVPPTSTPVPVTLSYSVTRTDGGPTTVSVGYAATFDVCVNVAPASNVTVFLTASHRTRATASPETLTFGPGASLCQAVPLTDRRKTASFDDTGGQSRLEVYSARSGTTFTGLLASGPYLTFPDDV